MRRFGRRIRAAAQRHMTLVIALTVVALGTASVLTAAAYTGAFTR